MTKKHEGMYIVFEGAEGTGKTTQIQLLADRLRANNYSVRLFREPDSQTDMTARTIRRMTQDTQFPMNTRTEVLLYNAARSQSLEIIKTAKENGVICLCDRNFLTTLAIQYYGRGDVPDYDSINNIIEFAVNGIYPDMTIILDAPTDMLYERARKRGQGERFDNLDPMMIDRIRAGYLLEAKKRGYPVLPAVGTVKEISEKIWDLVNGKTVKASPVKAPSISFKPPEPVASETEVSKEKLLNKTENGFQITAAGRNFLDKILTDSKGDIYAFSHNYNPVSVAAAMARLSRRFDDLRITLLDEFAEGGDANEALLKRVITAYGDDSVQQLVGQHVVVEGASNLLTKKIEWGRLASYLEQSTRYIFYDQKDKSGEYKYYTPENLDNNTRMSYKRIMDKIFDNYSEIVQNTTDYVRRNSTVSKEEQDSAWMAATRAQACDVARHVLPVATKSTVGIFASGQALENLIMRLTADDLPEAKRAGKIILREARKIIPSFLERADKPERGGATIAYHVSRRKQLQKLSDKYLNSKNTVFNDDVCLSDVHPRNELDIIPDMLYEFSDQSLEDIKREINGWSYKRKVEVFKAYIGERLNRRQKPGRALEKIHYSWDIVCDYGIFRDLQRHRMVEDLEWQHLTPRFGYEIPELIEKTDQTAKFLDCFDLSVELYSLMQATGYELEAQYCVLMGHKMRWKVTYNAREAFHLHELRTSPQGHPGYRKLVNKMHEQLTNIHPLLGESMKFVNQGEDPELTRLAAEKYTQYKLNELDKTNN